MSTPKGENMKPTPKQLRNRARALYVKRMNSHGFMTQTERHNFLRSVKRLAAQLDPNSTNGDMPVAVMFIDSIMLRENVHYPMIGEK